MSFLENIDYDWMDMLNFHERPFRAKLIPAKVWKALDKYRNDQVGLTNYCKKWRCKVEWFKEPSNSKVYDSYIAVGGEYDVDRRQVAIQIYTLKYNTFAFTEDSWNKFKYKFLQVLMHELVHFMQYDRRADECSYYVLPHKKVASAKKNNERKYLSEFDEIQAYAHCVYLDFKTFKPNTPIEVLLGRAHRRCDSKTLSYILKAFDYDYKNNEAIPKLMQQIIKWDRKYQRYCNNPK
jgi:hypothetical protein